RSAGRFVLLSGTTLMQAIATAGGYTEFAQPKKVRLLRGGKSTIHDLKQIEKNPDKDISIEAEDVIVVPRSVF
ncbi:MAG TPA: SLBB domain-containing protein, partial [Kiritimatiellia bacterium]|nr:SLBB domain-containing protein [Kiritimatiellia bacterium]